MSVQEGTVRLMDPSAMAKYGTPSADNGLEIDRVAAYGGGQDGDGSMVYRRTQEHPSFWTSVFSAYAPVPSGADLSPYRLPLQ